SAIRWPLRRMPSRPRAAAANPTLEEFFDQLDLNDEEFNDVDIDEDPGIKESVRWLALARVHTEKNFSPSAFYKDMRVAWNPAQLVRFRPVGPNRFVVQASCLGDWERIMTQGPWLFRNMAVLLCLYDGFSRAEDVVFVHMPIWLQIHKLTDPKENIVEKLLKGAGEIMEMRLNGNTRGDYVRVRVNHDIQQPLTKFVSIIRAREHQVYLVRYEKLARFCKACGLIGHEHKE
uniref:Zinc knuckle CX2CX4HX4C domain-containing protein n=1 Tax=Aegilops tauschii subsp. strangulata TaxID=200361 RepID=A0A453MHK4_AEGTS